jgi:hypothetical protein
MIQILAYRGRSFVSKLIRWQTRSVYSHIAVRFTEDMWVKLGTRDKYIHAGNVIEAWTKGGVSLHHDISTVHTPGTRVDVFEFDPPLSEAEENTIAGFLVKQLGKAYDFHAIVHFLTREPLDHWRKQKWFCSELAFEACLTGGKRLLERCSAWEIPPRDIPRSPILRMASHELTS